MADNALLVPPGPFSAYLFDLDGTVADSMPLHYRSWSQAVEEQGNTFPEDLFYNLGGIPLPRTVEMLNEQFGYHMAPAETARRKEELYLSMLSEMQPVAAVVEHIHAQHGKIPFAIVSGSPRASIYKTLEILGLLDHFKVIVGAEDYTHGKPDPEPFLTAAARLGVAAKECLVWEDADAGIASAEAAGMQWVRIPHSLLRGATQ
ncbi:HAD family phosphatase [Acidipila sp. EB88]|uniref:HAD family hydrolase n=1 Tax=Acidipila sp. EB88 TaxID=2305226 RepID=UPI000F5E1CAA|nr:HAD family phosphatase [Acidipila sp. EB88]RRA49716.1 HAD family phosphatase [Acidipila sp. EB88]